MHPHLKHALKLERVYFFSGSLQQLLQLTDIHFPTPILNALFQNGFEVINLEVRTSSSASKRAISSGRISLHANMLNLGSNWYLQEQQQLENKTQKRCV